MELAKTFFQILLIALAFGLTVFFSVLQAVRLRRALHVSSRVERLWLRRREKKSPRAWPSISLQNVSVLERVRVFVKVYRGRKRFVGQLPDALDALVSALRAGYALPYALQLVARETQGMAQEVFGALARAETYQLPLRQAVARLGAQLKTQEWDLVAETLEIQGAIGGNMVPVLEEVARTLRDKIRVDQEVSSATASGRFSGILIAALAPLSLVAFAVFSPSYISILTQTTLGQGLLALAGILEVIGFSIIWKMVSIDY